MCRIESSVSIDFKNINRSNIIIYHIFFFCNNSTKQWKVFTGNEIGALLGWWSAECFKRQNPGKSLDNCYMLASTVSSKILRSMARAEGFHFIETLTGFKWMGNSLLDSVSRHTFCHRLYHLWIGNRTVELLAEKKTVLFAFEEAIGFMFSPAVLDKDGVSAACHLATLAAHLNHSGRTLGRLLEELYHKYGFHFTHNSYYLCYEPIVIEKIFHRIRNLKGQPNTVHLNDINRCRAIIYRISFYAVCRFCDEWQVSDPFYTWLDHGHWYVSTRWKSLIASQ